MKVKSFPAPTAIIMAITVKKPSVPRTMISIQKSYPFSTSTYFLFTIVNLHLLFFLGFPTTTDCASFSSKENSLHSNYPSISLLKPWSSSRISGHYAHYFQDQQTPFHHRRPMRHLHKQHRRHAENDFPESSDKNNNFSENHHSAPSPPKQAPLLMQPRQQQYRQQEQNYFDVEKEQEQMPKKIVEDFPYGYWVRVAQAKVLALVVENGTLPKLVEESQLIKPADCPHDTQCHEFITKCAKEKADRILQQLYDQRRPSPTRQNLTLYMNQILRECDLKLYPFHPFSPSDILDHHMSYLQPLPPNTPVPLPIFHCNLYKGKGEVTTNVRLEYPNHQDIANLTSDLIPRFFVVEVNQNSKWLFPRLFVQAHWIIRFIANTSQSYRIRVTAVSPKYIYPPVTTSLINIYKNSDLTVENPKDLQVVNVTIDDSASRPTPSALLRWKSGSGQNASCDFNVYYMDDEMRMVERTSGDEAFWVKLDGLEYGKNYTIKVIEKYGGGKETNVSSSLYVPTCLEMRGFSFDLCAPPIPRNIRKVNATDKEFWIVWNPPKYVNATNKILNYTLSVGWMPIPSSGGSVQTIMPPVSPDIDISEHHDDHHVVSTSGHHQQHPPMKIIFSGYLPGNQTKFLIANATRGRYKVTVTAISSYGKSPEMSVVLEYKGSPLSDWTLGKILSLVFVLFGVVGLIVFLCVLKNFHERRQRKKKRQEKFDVRWSEKNYEKESLQLQQMGERDATKWEIEWCNLDLKEGIGQGNFGLVRRAFLNQKGKRMVVAVKTLRDGVDTKDVEKLWEEYEILKNLDPHVHVVGLKGIVTKHVPLPLLVVEFCDGGNLQSHLRKVVESAGYYGSRRYSPSTGTGVAAGEAVGSTSLHSACSSSHGSTTLSAGSSHSSIVGNLGNPPSSARIVTNAAYFLKEMEQNGGQNTPPTPPPPPPPLTIADLLSYARQVACGMEYLSNNKIVHRDLAARNILLSGKSRILKISDFGLSRDVYEQSWYKMTSKDEIPIKWLAVESIMNDIYTTKSDVWSYGILLWEIFTYGGNPYPGVINMKVFELLNSGYRMPRPDTCPVELYQLMRLCWEDEPNRRPDFTSIRLILEEIIEKTTHVTYLNLEASTKGGVSLMSSRNGEGGFAQYKNCDSGFDEFDGGSNEPVLPPRNKKKFSG